MRRAAPRWIGRGHNAGCRMGLVGAGVGVRQEERKGATYDFVLDRAGDASSPDDADAVPRLSHSRHHPLLARCYAAPTRQSRLLPPLGREYQARWHLLPIGVSART